jgi:hypothetical protein
MVKRGTLTREMRVQAEAVAREKRVNLAGALHVARFERKRLMAVGRVR